MSAAHAAWHAWAPSALKAKWLHPALRIALFEPHSILWFSYGPKLIGFGVKPWKGSHPPPDATATVVYGAPEM